MAQHLNQRRIRCIGQQRLRVLEILCKAEQIAVFLIDLANIFLPAVNAQRAIACGAATTPTSRAPRGR